MPICSKCYSIVDDEADQCPFCGQKIEQGNIDTKHKEANSTTHKVTLDRSEEIPQLIVEKQKAYPQPDNYETEEETAVFHSPDIEEIELDEHQSQEIPLSLAPVPERNYLLWVGLGIITVGICFLVYLYLNFEDLEKHSHYPLEIKAKPIKVNPSSLLILFFIAICFLFIPILWYMYYTKYSSLYNHIREQKKETAPVKILHPVFYMIPLVLSHLLALVPTIIFWISEINIQTVFSGWYWAITAGVIICTLVTFILDYLWQKAFNQHSKIAMINLNVIEEPTN